MRYDLPNNYFFVTNDYQETNKSCVEYLTTLTSRRDYLISKDFF